MLSCMNNPTAHAKMGDFGLRTPEQLVALNISTRVTGFPDIDLIYMISLKSDPDNELMGAVTLGQRTKDLAPDIGWALLEKYMGKGYATEAAKELLRALREDMGVRDVCTWPSQGNKESNRVAEKLGFVDGGSVISRDEGGRKAQILILPGMARVKEGLEIGMWGEGK
jgi:hypothetical protein